MDQVDSAGTTITGKPATAAAGEVERASRPRRVLVLGATGTIGRAAVRALIARGHDVVCLVRPRGGTSGTSTPQRPPVPAGGAVVRFGDVTDRSSIARDAIRGERFDALLSCLASRTGTARDAWAIDHAAHVAALDAARQAGVQHMVLLSAICVQKPRLPFQHAKLAFERELIGSGLTYSIVRPTTFFKSLSGQVERVRRGKPYLIFGDGQRTACKPIGDDDLGAYLADCLDDEDRWDRILPIGGPGPAVTPRQQGEHLFRLLGREPRFRSVPPGLIRVLGGLLAIAGRVSPAMADKAELAAIGHYYATESMLVLDPATGRYSADATPSTGSQTLFDHYAGLVSGAIADDRGDHAVF